MAKANIYYNQKADTIINDLRSYTDQRCRLQRQICGCPQCFESDYRELRSCGCDRCYDTYKQLRQRQEQHRYGYMPDRYSQMTPGVYATGIDLGYEPKQLTSGDDMNLVDKVKNLKLSAADKLLRKHGVVDSDGNLTGVGEDLLQVKLFEAYKEDIVADLKAVDAAEKGKK